MNQVLEENLDLSLRQVLPIMQDRIMTQSTYFGVKALKSPIDYWVYQEIIVETKPDVIIEIGNAYGGGTLALAHFCDLLGRGRVVGVDISHASVPPRVRSHPRITLLEGDACQSIDAVARLVSEDDHVLVIEDSSHTYDNTLQILRSYSMLLKQGDYFIVEDGICHHGLSIGPKPGPYEAIEKFLSENTQFEGDRSKESFLITWNPKGYLRRRYRSPDGLPIVASNGKEPKPRSNPQHASEPVKTPLSWTGERLVPTVNGHLAAEHLHRYGIAMDLARGKTVLDIASGEGYGASLLADVAERVIGVDVALDAIKHARATYCRSNLEFILGDCANVPLESSSIDLVVSFETIEHHDQHRAMMAEIARVLRPNGSLIISSPNKHEFSDIPNHKNPFHVAELYLDQFKALLKCHFSNVYISGQRVVSGSFSAPLQPESADLHSGCKTYTGGFALIECKPGVHRPLYFIAVASNGELPGTGASLFECDSSLLQEEDIISLQSQVARLQKFSDAVRGTWLYRIYRTFLKPALALIQSRP